MSGQPYIDGSTLDEAREAIRQGVTLQSIAGKLHCSPEHLANLLGLPQWKEVPTGGAETSVDLWATDNLTEVL